MQKFDASCGLTNKQIHIIKYNVKNAILRQLPILPEHVETKLFLEGRDAWIFSWCLLNKQNPIESTDEISLEVVAKLKREFHQYQESTQYKFSCKVQLRKDIYRPKVSITKNSA
jgi:hypothetical protein